MAIYMMFAAKRCYVLEQNDGDNSSITLNASDVIRASNIISGTSKVICQEANKIELLPGFSVAAGRVFTAKI